MNDDDKFNITNDRRETPPPPATTGLKEWFAGLALGNPEIMRDIPPEKRVEEAVRLASELISALAQPRTPSSDVHRVPTVTELSSWSDRIEHRARVTVPEMPAAKHRSSMLPPPLPLVHPENALEQASTATITEGPNITEGPKTIHEPNGGQPGRYALVSPKPEVP